MDRKKQLTVNIIAQIIVFVANLGINFFVTPYIVNQLGSEAYGFVGLANNFVNYASLVTIALNSMLGRFVTIAIYQGDVQRANKYYNSVLFANLLIAGVMMIPISLCVIFLDKLVNIPAYLIVDVKLTFIIVFCNFIMNVMTSAFGICFFVKNKLYLNSIRTIESNILRIVVVIGLFVCFSPSITFMVLGSFVSSIFMAISSIYYNRRIMPELLISKKYVKITYIKELLESGVWNVITKLSQIFSSGLDLLIANLFVDSYAMGMLSIAKTVPNLIVSFISTISGAFSPDMTILYAKKDINEFVKTSRSAMKLLAIIASIPNAILFVFGAEFFSLWLPKENAQILQILSVLTVVNSCITGPLQPLYNIFTITNKVRCNSVAMIIYGVVSLTTTLIVLKFTSLGVYAIAGVSLVLSIIIALGFHVPVTAKLIGLKWNTFFPEIIKSIFSFFLIVIFASLLKMICYPGDWLKLIIVSLIVALIGFLLNIYIFLNKEERVMIINKIKNKYSMK